MRNRVVQGFIGRTTIAIGLAIGIVAGISLAADKPSGNQGWELVRSVTDPPGLSIDLVLVPESHSRDRDYYTRIADTCCGTRLKCMVHFWTDRDHIPTSAWMSTNDLRFMTAQYERHPSYEAPVLRLACWLYPNREAGENMKCFYMPGAAQPPEK